MLIQILQLSPTNLEDNQPEAGEIIWIWNSKFENTNTLAVPMLLVLPLDPALKSYCSNSSRSQEVLSESSTSGSVFTRTWSFTTQDLLASANILMERAKSCSEPITQVNVSKTFPYTLNGTPFQPWYITSSLMSSEGAACFACQSDTGDQEIRILKDTCDLCQLDLD